MALLAASLTLILTILSFYLRLNFWPLYQNFGFYQGDIWYFFTYYGSQIKDQPFYQMDYPIGYVLIQKLSAFISLRLFQEYSYSSFLYANALLITPLTTLSTILILRIAQLRNLDKKHLFFYFVLSPSLFVYSTINYDVFPLFSIVLAIYLLFTQRFLLSILSLSLGFLIKIYPVFLIPLFILFIYQNTNSIKKALLSLGLFLLTVTAVNLPFAIYNFRNWLYPYLHQVNNPERNDPTTISFYFNSLGLESYRILLPVSLIAFAYVICFVFFKRNRLTPNNMLLLSFFILYSLVLGNHVYTPQYVLWFLPFVALIKIPNFLLWYVFDITNAAARFFYFRLQEEFAGIFFTIHTSTILMFLLLYILLLKYVKKALS